jgi:TPR repeat protein
MRRYLESSIVCTIFMGVLACMLLAASSSAQTDAKTPSDDDALRGKYYALVIGINAYAAPVPQLHTAVGDAKALADVLTRRYGFEVKTLFDGEATREHILASITHYEIALKPNDNLLIYYAGHGFENKTANKSYWLPVDANSMMSSNRISSDDLTTEMATLRARHVLLISDSCYSGGLTRSFDDPMLSKGQDAFLRKMLEGRSRNLMASGGDEPVDDGGPEGHSIFAYAVLKALQGEDQSIFTASDLFYGYVQRRVAGSSAQMPHYVPIRNSGDENGDFVFRRLDISPAEEKKSLTAPAAGFEQGMALYRGKQYLEASRLFTTLCDSSEARSCTTLGYLFQNGLGVAKDPVQAVTLYRKACDGGIPLGCSNLGAMYDHGNGVTKDSVQAVALYRKGCDGGIPLGCSNLGAMYDRGTGVAKDPVQAVALYRKSCDGGIALGCSNLGAMYDHGNGVAKDAAQAVALYRKGCDGGIPLGCSNLGAMYDHGNGVAKDAAQAATLYRKGCDAGESLGCTDLGFMYGAGDGVTKDAVQAVALYRKGCDGGNARGCTALGFRYATGDGVGKDVVQAVALYRKGCDGGDALGCSNLGVMYRNGDGVAKDAVQAAALFHKSCDGGSAHGCELLKKLK